MKYSTFYASTDFISISILMICTQGKGGGGEFAPYATPLDPPLDNNGISTSPLLTTLLPRFHCSQFPFPPFPPLTSIAISSVKSLTITSQTSILNVWALICTWGRTIEQTRLIAITLQVAKPDSPNPLVDEANHSHAASLWIAQHPAINMSELATSSYPHTHYAVYHAHAQQE